MIKSEVIALADIEPDKNNPRQEFEGLEELAESFQYTPDRPNEPFTPMIVVKDGNIYRIVDGERRYRALIQAKKVDQVLCNVADTFEEAHAVAMMLATDDKAPLTKSEKSQGVQTMLCLGVDFDKVDTLGKLKKGQAKKIKQLLSSRRDHQIKPVQIDMDKLIEIADLDNPNRIGELIELYETDPDNTDYNSEFRSKLRSYQSEAKGIENYRLLKELVSKLGLTMLEEMPEDGTMVELDCIYVGPGESIDDLMEEAEEDIAEACEDYGVDRGNILAFVFLGGQINQADKWGCTPSTKLYFFAKPEDCSDDAEYDQVPESPESIAEKRAREEFNHEWDEAEKRHFVWACEHLDVILKGEIGKHCCKKASELIDKDRLKTLENYRSVDVDVEPWMIAAFWPKCDPGWTLELFVDIYAELCEISDWNTNIVIKEIKRYSKIKDMLKADGYEPNDFEIALEDALETWRSGVDNQKDEVDDQAA